MFLVMPMAKCIETNNLLFGPMSKIITDVEGALGGLLFGLVTVVVVLLAVLALVTVLNKKAQVYMRAAAFVLFIPLVVIIGLILYNGLIVGFNNVC